MLHILRKALDTIVLLIASAISVCALASFGFELDLAIQDSEPPSHGTDAITLVNEAGETASLTGASLSIVASGSQSKLNAWSLAAVAPDRTPARLEFTRIGFDGIDKTATGAYMTLPSRKEDVYARIMPGYFPQARSVPFSVSRYTSSTQYAQLALDRDGGHLATRTRLGLVSSKVPKSDNGR